MAASHPDTFPPAFAAAVATLAGVGIRPEIILSEATAPGRVAPHAVALSAEVSLPDDVPATGRFVVLHDPASPEAWAGDTRVVAYLKADVDPESAGDPLLTAVAWSWLTDALTGRSADVVNLGGTVTRVSSERFGALADPAAGGGDAQVELRASWTPVESTLDAHLKAFADLLAAAAGLEPLIDGVAVLPTRRARLASHGPGRAR